MDASYKIQRGIHVHLIQFFMCPEFWVHIISCIINMNYIDLNLVQEARVTFEADNNLDFRLGTGAFRYTKKAKENDLALITRLSEYDYEMRIVSTEDKKYTQLSAYATSYIGNYGKRFGYIANSELFNILDK